MRNFAALLAFGLIIFSQPLVRGQDEDKIKKLFQDAIQALGGDTYLKVTDMTSEGNYFMFDREGNSTGLIKYTD